MVHLIAVNAVVLEWSPGLAVVHGLVDSHGVRSHGAELEAAGREGGEGGQNMNIQFVLAVNSFIVSGF